MTDRERLMIQEYLPNPPDPTLGFEEFYYRQSTMKGEQVIKVQVISIFPGQIGGDLEYGIYQIFGNSLRWVDTGWGDRNRGCHRSELYDNKDDCRDQTHLWCENWEHLRELQRQEAQA